MVLNPDEGLGIGRVGIGALAPTAQLDINIGAAATPGLRVKGASSQSANLQEWQNNAGTVLSVVSPSGSVGIGTSSPDAALTLKTSDNANVMTIKDNGGNNILTFINNWGTGSMTVLNNGTPKAYMNSDPASGSMLFADGSSNNIADGAVNARAAGLTISAPYVVGQENGILFTNYPSAGYTPGAGVTSYTAAGGTYGIQGLKFKTENGSLTTRMTIDQNGKVGIGVTSPVEKLDINGNVKLAKNSAQPYTCDATHDGVVALTSQYTTCVCNGGATSWVRTSDGSTACSW